MATCSPSQTQRSTVPCTVDTVVSVDTLDTADTADTVYSVISAVVIETYDDIRPAYFRVCCELVAHKPKAEWTAAERQVLAREFGAAVRSSGIDATDDELSVLLEGVWDSVRFGGGREIWERGWVASASSVVPACAERYTDSRHRRLVSWCLELSRLCNGVFILPCRTVQVYFGLKSHKQASVWLKMLRRDKVIEVVKKPRGRLKGYRYRFIGEEF